MTTTAMELRVLSGLHAGGALRLTAPRVLVGSGGECDVVLLDDGVEPVHLILERRDGVWHDGRGGVALQIGIPMSVGRALLALCAEGASFDWPASREASEAAGSVPAPPSPPPAELAALPVDAGTVQRASLPRRGDAAWLLPVAGALLLVALASAGVLALLADPSPAQAHGVPSPSAAERRRPSGALLRAEAVSALRQRDLTSVTLEAGAGQLVVRGSVADEQRPRLEEALAALRREFGATVVIENRVVAAPPVPRLAFSEVVVGPVSYVTLVGGRRVYVGEMIGDMRLVSISAGKLLLVGSRRMEVRW